LGLKAHSPTLASLVDGNTVITSLTLRGLGKCGACRSF
jgi:hypothetical protein